MGRPAYVMTPSGPGTGAAHLPLPRLRIATTLTPGTEAPAGGAVASTPPAAVSRPARVMIIRIDGRIATLLAPERGSFAPVCTSRCWWRTKKPVNGNDPGYAAHERLTGRGLAPSAERITGRAGSGPVSRAPPAAAAPGLAPRPAPGRGTPGRPRAARTRGPSPLAGPWPPARTARRRYRSRPVPRSPALQAPRPARPGAEAARPAPGRAGPAPPHQAPTRQHRPPRPAKPSRPVPRP